MRYELLGSLRMVDGDDIRSISAPKIESVLAVLVISADEVVGFDRIVAEIWQDNPPRRAAAAVHVYVSQLRKVLQRPGHRESPLVTREPGYLLRTGSDEIDYHEFVQLAENGRQAVADGHDEQASRCFEAALRLWRGPALENLRTGAIVDTFVTWISELRLECQEMLADAQLNLGRHREIVGWLRTLVAENPFREIFYRHLMLALYRSERQAEALQVYQTARKLLQDELGLEPCRALRELQQDILADAGHLDLPLIGTRFRVPGIRDGRSA